VAGAMAPARMRKARAQAEEFPALRSGSPCGRHVFSTLPNPPGLPLCRQNPAHRRAVCRAAEDARAA
jgi:hypothetical protein